MKINGILSCAQSSSRVFPDAQCVGSVPGCVFDDESIFQYGNRNIMLKCCEMLSTVVYIVSHTSHA